MSENEPLRLACDGWWARAPGNNMVGRVSNWRRLKLIFYGNGQLPVHFVFVIRCVESLWSRSAKTTVDSRCGTGHVSHPLEQNQLGPQATLKLERLKQSNFWIAIPRDHHPASVQLLFQHQRFALPLSQLHQSILR